MKNLRPINSSPTYIGGWHIALHNYNAVEIESINQLISLLSENKRSNSGTPNKNYFTTNLDDMPSA